MSKQDASVIYRPDNVMIKNLFYVFRFLRRIPFYLPLDETYKQSVLDDVKHWSKETYEEEFNKAFNSLALLDPSTRDPNKLSYPTLEEWFKGPMRVVVYEWLHHIRWKRLSDALAYNQSKYIGFHWTDFFSTRGEH